MQHVRLFIIGLALAATLILMGMGCSSNPMASECTTSCDQDDSSVVSDHVSEEDGGNPTTPSTTIDKYETSNEPQNVGMSP